MNYQYFSFAFPSGNFSRQYPRVMVCNFNSLALGKDFESLSSQLRGLLSGKDLGLLAEDLVSDSIPESMRNIKFLNQSRDILRQLNRIRHPRPTGINQLTFDPGQDRSFLVDTLLSVIPNWRSI